MKSPLTSLLYDPATFPLSPNFESWGASEIDGKIYFASDGEYPEPESNFLCTFSDEHQAEVLGVPEGNYKMTASVLDGDNRFKISFSIYGADNKEVETILFDAKGYIQDYSYAFNASAIQSMDQAEEFEADFSIKYLKRVLGKRIEGSQAFWERLFGDMDAATAPLNVQIIRDIEGLPQLPIEIVRNLD